MKIEIQRVRTPAPELNAMFDRWTRDAATDPIARGAERCQSIAKRLSAVPPQHEVNYVILANGRVVGGIHTSGEHFNVIWIHWSATRQRLGPRVTRIVLAKQLAEYGVAYVNMPNEKMCTALRRILVSSRSSEIATNVTLRVSPGDLRAHAIATETNSTKDPARQR